MEFTYAPEFTFSSQLCLKIYQIYYIIREQNRIFYRLSLLSGEKAKKSLYNADMSRT